MSLLDAEETARLERWIRITGAVSMGLIALGVLMAAFYAPLLPDCDVVAAGNCQTSPLGQKIFYFHVPAAFAAYLGLTLLAFASYRYLSRESVIWDAFAVGAAEAGVLFAAVTLYTGSLWGHLEWGADTFGYWSNDDTKLVLTLILFLVYVGYLVLRRQIDDPRRRARIGAVYALFGFATVPLSYVAQRVWRSIHPTIFNPGDPTSGIVTPSVEYTFVVNLAALLVLTVFLLLVRFRLEVARRDRVENLGGAAA